MSNSIIMTNTLFTIDYSGRSIDKFIALLEHHKMTALCDVRSVPYSGRNPQFNRELLKKALKSHNIEYVFLGEELGARTRDPSCYVNRKAVYQKIAESALFKNGLERIRVGMQKGYVLALMCAERDPMAWQRIMGSRWAGEHGYCGLAGRPPEISTEPRSIHNGPFKKRA